ncbi:unnamed protein product, partial [Mesorhabditis spiculigera]
MVEPTVGVALGALGTGVPVTVDPIMQQQIQQDQMGLDAQQLQQRNAAVASLQEQQLRQLQQNLVFGQTPIVSFQPFNQPAPYPTIFAPTFPGANPFQQPFYSAAGLQQLAQEFDWRMQAHASTSAAAAMLATPMYQPQQLTLDLHSRISQAVRSTLQHVRVLENTRSR